MGVAEVGGAALEAVVDASLGFEVDKELGGTSGGSISIAFAESKLSRRLFRERRESRSLSRAL